MSIHTISDAIRAYLYSSAVRKPPTTATYAPSYSQNFQPNYSPAAIIILSDAAKAFLRAQQP